ncbi:hypothetical protein B0H13DRAFT_1874849 [Mycena leptocephala]|nr:hypothetical protein B0H13DRAFT_1874849 [Mycena leptocephala]
MRNGGVRVPRVSGRNIKWIGNCAVRGIGRRRRRALLGEEHGGKEAGDAMADGRSGKTSPVKTKASTRIAPKLHLEIGFRRIEAGARGRGGGVCRRRSTLHPSFYLALWGATGFSVNVSALLQPSQLPFCLRPSSYTSKMDFVTQGSPSWTLKDGADLAFDFVATSQPFEDGEEDLSWNRGPAARVDFVGTSQPLEDGEDFGLITNNSEQHVLPAVSESTNTPLASSQTRATHLAQKPRPEGASPTAATISATSIARPSRLVRRVTMLYSLSSLKAAEMERRRRRAREAAQRIMKKIRSLAKTTASLRRRHRKLREFVANSADTSNSFAVFGRTILGHVEKSNIHGSWGLPLCYWPAAPSAMSILVDGGVTNSRLLLKQLS